MRKNGRLGFWALFNNFESHFSPQAEGGRKGVALGGGGSDDCCGAAREHSESCSVVDQVGVAHAVDFDGLLDIARGRDCGIGNFDDCAWGVVVAACSNFDLPSGLARRGIASGYIAASCDAG